MDEGVRRDLKIRANKDDLLRKSSSLLMCFNYSRLCWLDLDLR